MNSATGNNCVPFLDATFASTFASCLSRADSIGCCFADAYWPVLSHSVLYCRDSIGRFPDAYWPVLSQVTLCCVVDAYWPVLSQVTLCCVVDAYWPVLSYSVLYCRDSIGRCFTDAYWPVLRKHRGSMGYSMMEAQQHEREEADTVSALASLSVVKEDPA